MAAATAAPASSIKASPLTPRRCALWSAPRIASPPIAARVVVGRQCVVRMARSRSGSLRTGSVEGSGTGRVASLVGDVTAPPSYCGRSVDRQPPASRTVGLGQPLRWSSSASAAAGIWPVRADGRRDRQPCVLVRPAQARHDPAPEPAVRGLVRGHDFSRATRPGRHGRRAPRAASRTAIPTSGHAAQSGRDGLQIVAPMSLSAAVQSAGRWTGTMASAVAWMSRGGIATPGSRRCHARPTRPSTRRTLVSTGPTGLPNAMAATARAVYGPTPATSSRRPDRPVRPQCRSTMARAARCRLSARRL
jgi:hypothetical protein